MIKTIAAASIATFLVAAPASAQNNNVDVGGGKGLVVVDVSGVNLDLLRQADIEVLNDGTAAVPITVAAVLCDTEVNAIASSNDKGNKSCTATAAGAENFANR